MKQDTIKKALVRIEERRKVATEKLDALRAELSKDPTFLDIQRRYTEEKIENARKIAYGEQVDRSEEQKLKAQYDKYFSSVQPEYSCTLCNDTGYVNGQMCKCLKQEISHILYEESNFGSLVNFEEAEKCADSTLKPVYALMKKWCLSDFKKNLIFISGKVGVGKTYLTRAMANELISRGKMVKLTTAFEMSKDFKDYRYNYEESTLDKYLDCEVLFIDDLGTEIIYKNSTVELLYLVINERKMKKLCTVITSNLDLDEVLDRYGERISSRIIDKETSICLNLAGEDKRTKRQ